MDTNDRPIYDTGEAERIAAQLAGGLQHRANGAYGAGTKLVAEFENMLVLLNERSGGRVSFYLKREHPGFLSIHLPGTRGPKVTVSTCEELIVADDDGFTRHRVPVAYNALLGVYEGTEPDTHYVHEPGKPVARQAPLAAIMEVVARLLRREKDENDLARLPVNRRGR